MKNNASKIKVIAAAVKTLNGLIFSVIKPYRHHDLINNLTGLIIIEQGFLLSDGTYVNRKEAAKIAIYNKQINKLNNPPLLFTEDLW